VAIKRVARRNGMSLSGYVRDLVIDHLLKIGEAPEQTDHSCSYTRERPVCIERKKVDI